MGVAVPGPSGQASLGRPTAERDPRHERHVVVAVVVATLAIIVGPLLAGSLGLVGRLVPVDEHTLLTPMAQRVLDELPGAAETAGLVVVPAHSDPNRAWLDHVTPGMLEGEVVGLGVRGLMEYASLPLDGQAPIWLSTVSPTDRVFTDVGPLTFACVRFPGARECTGSLLMEHGGERFILRSGLALGDPDAGPHRVRVLDASGPAELLFGGAPPGTSSVALTLSGATRQEVQAQVSRPGAVGGTTLWWAPVSAPVTTVRFLDGAGRPLGEVGAAD